MNVSRCGIGFIVLAAATLAPLAQASPISFKETVTGSGSLGGIAFTNQTVTLAASGNTSSVVLYSPGIYNLPATTTVQVGSGAAYTFTDTINVVDNQLNDSAGFGDFTSNLAILFTTNSAFATYSLQTSVSGSGIADYNPGTSFATTGGTFILNAATANSTFAATTSSVGAVPEPSSLLLLATGLTGTAWRRLRRKA